MTTRSVAVISDVMMTVGGAEVVTEAIMEMYPEADFYCLFFTPAAKKRFKKKFPKSKIHVSWWQMFVRSNEPSKYLSLVKLLSWTYWENLYLSKYDLIISSSNSYMCKNVKRSKNAIHISYIHAPPRFLYKEFNQIGWIKKRPWIWILSPVMYFLKWIDLRGSKRPDVIAAASLYVAERIKKYYDRESVVIYPPVWVPKVEKFKRSGYICLNRLVKQKGTELAVRSCNAKSFELKVVGEGYEENYLKSIAGGSVKFVGKKVGVAKWNLLSKAKALIYTSREEDFGIVAVEAMGVGTPVVAFRSGGVTETVIDGKTGVLYNEFSEKSLTDSLEKLNNLNIDPEVCKKWARNFSKEKFVKSFENLINCHVGKN